MLTSTCGPFWGQTARRLQQSCQHIAHKLVGEITVGLHLFVMYMLLKHGLQFNQFLTLLLLCLVLERQKNTTFSTQKVETNDCKNPKCERPVMHQYMMARIK